MKKEFLMPVLKVNRFELIRTALTESKPLQTATYDAQVSYTQIKAQTQTQNVSPEVK